MSIEFDVDSEGVATIVINRPERMNAMDQDAYDALSDAWTRVRDDKNVRVAIVTGAGDKSFTVGADIKSFLPAEDEPSEFWLTQQSQLLNRGLEVWKPVIAAVNGYCLGGGMTLLFATDLRVASEHATFGLTEVKRGIFAGNGGTQRVLENLPKAIAMDMLLTGDSITATEAERWGLVNKVVSADKLMDEARDYASRIAKNAPLAVQASKELALRSRDMDLSTGLRMEQAMTKVLKTTWDSKEGPSAFAERRQPAFRGE
ncbi:enoyl-CoA hydratase/isomerase family protein [Rhodococcus sp. 06-156-3C]|uniref:enoyl-CoA hydratase/isomerase family protein n=1 Tax=Nocardiaceae TaxID=85025 RepID=UPI0005230C83|nr:MULTISPECIES: enoyl-CoA hydratase/isomerase family protein [Rhodococcus]OZD13074.1 enoyl-CoA hydratase/isomerase family protein [Rhodococcus sp. 06-156-4a]OZD17943.1 enoyl-CoA hydratase/isomerase family protein [Rhodococcus sp. 06-156-3C]OZD20667.1 enoyl-CoA hydratase/isomerase family protein [Rhodococcus sp. 06-156-4C]OZD30615.1 enoyl-CoA hydratase/isomerase family protein [Rhodococcus sp. 06-156-3b]OZD32613.1 enoyl-CoA hydratase/isomerase family protein [Rhodococcus sp. 06-156-3]